MSKNSYKYITYNDYSYGISNNALKYNLKKEDVNNKYQSIFEHYDSNNDNILDKSELDKLNKDLKEANCDNDKDTLSKKEAKAFLEKIFPNKKISRKVLFGFLDSLQVSYKNTINNISDGIIDWTAQGREGNCWLLSEVRALSQTKWGAEAIKNSISDDSVNKVYTVKLKGVNFTCNISYDEIIKERKNKNRASGDIDMLLLELATEKYFKQEVNAGRMKRDGENVLDGGPLMGEDTMQYLLTGKRGHSFYMQSQRMSDEEIAEISQEIRENNEYREYYTKYRNNISNLYDRDAKVKFMQKLAEKIKTSSITCCFKDKKDWDNKQSYTRSEKRNNFNHQDQHVYTIENIIIDTNGNITDILLNNPWDPDITIHKSLNEFLDQVEEICVTNEHDNYEDLEQLSEGCWVKI